MARKRTAPPRILSCLLLGCSASAGCNTTVPPADTGAVAGETGDEDQVADPERWSPWCGEPGDEGYLIECYVPEGEQVLYTRDGTEIHEEGPGALTEYLGGGACCGGCSSGWPDDCQHLCRIRMCNEARQWHNQNNGVCSVCDFDIDACINDSSPSRQVLHRVWHPLGEWIYWAYDLEIDCEAATGDYTDHGRPITIGDWPFDRKEEALTRRFGEAWPPASTLLHCSSDDYLAGLQTCRTPEDLSPTEGAPGQFAAEEDAGTSARLEWHWAGWQGSLEEAEIDIDLRYDVVPCENSKIGSCLQIAALSAHSDGTYQSDDESNVVLDAMELRVIGKDPKGIPLARRDSFEIPAESLEALVSFDSSKRGTTSVAIQNRKGASGRLDPTSGSVSIRNLSFDFDGFGLQARLTLNIAASYTERPPSTSIAVLENPRVCSDPIVFRAVSNDLDGGQLRHIWWSNMGTLGEGPLLEKVLPEGPGLIVLTTVDADGHFATDNITIDRTCE